MSTSGKKNLKIVALCSVAIFSLGTVLSGAYAWFTLIARQQTESDPFAVVNTGTCDLYGVDLIKFDYHQTTYGSGEGAFTIIDYLNPEQGAVNSYTFDKDEGKFGYEDHGEFVPVTAMNTYDPVSLVIYGGDLIDLNCNAVYKFTVTSQNITGADLNASVARLVDKVKQENELFLSSCADIDLYIASELDDSNPAFHGDDPSTPETETTYKTYYPSYISQSATLTDLEDVYYKISYLSSIASSHTHLYGQSEDEVSIRGNIPVSFVTDPNIGSDALTFYVNVNYSPSQLEPYKTKIYASTIHVVYDLFFKFTFLPEDNS